MKQLITLLFISYSAILFSQEASFFYESSVFKIKKSGQLDIHNTFTGERDTIKNFPTDIEFESFHHSVAILVDSVHTDTLEEIKSDLNLKKKLESIYKKFYPNPTQQIVQSLENQNLVAGQIRLKKSLVHIEKTYEKLVETYRDTCIKEFNKQFETGLKQELSSGKISAREFGREKEVIIRECMLEFNDEEIKAFHEDSLQLKIDSVAFSISDNFIQNIVIMGEVIDSDGRVHQLERPIINYNYGLPLFSGNPKHSVSFRANGIDSPLTIYYEDIFNFLPSRNGAYSLAVKDDEFLLKPNTSKELGKRGLYDYLSIVLFSDLIGLGDNQPNNLIQSELEVYLPIRSWSNKYSPKIRWFSNANASVRLSLYSGNDESENDFLRINNDTITPDTFFVDHFDLLRNNNTQIDVRLTMLSSEFKPTNLFLQWIVGVNSYRAGFTQKQINAGEDETKIHQLWSVSPYTGLEFKYKPDLNFGADLFVGLSRLSKRNASNNLPLIYESDGLHNDAGTIRFKKMQEIDRYIISTNLNLYAHLNDKSKGGLFARISTSFKGFNANDNFFPQVLVGYSTNLDQYIGRLRKE